MQFLDLICIAATAALAATGAGSTPPSVAVTRPASATLSVTFTGIEAKQGRIMVALYDEAGWQGGKPIRAEMVDVSAAETAIDLSDLPAGRYGVKAFHDVNGNGKMDANPFGMPIEPFAFSNNARGEMGPARWADAVFTVAPGANTQTITIR